MSAPSFVDPAAGRGQRPREPVASIAIYGVTGGPAAAIIEFPGKDPLRERLVDIGWEGPERRMICTSQTDALFRARRHLRELRYRGPVLVTIDIPLVGGLKQPMRAWTSVHDHRAFGALDWQRVGDPV